MVPYKLMHSPSFHPTSHSQVVLPVSGRVELRQVLLAKPQLCKKLTGKSSTVHAGGLGGQISGPPRGLKAWARLAQQGRWEGGEKGRGAGTRKVMDPLPAWHQ